MTVGAGTRLRAAQSVLANAGQRIGLDPASASATVGWRAVQRRDRPAPASLRPARAQVAGVEFVRADGVVVRSAGHPARNTVGDGPAGQSAADTIGRDSVDRPTRGTFGYDLVGLLCGSAGTLGLITSATVHLHPVPRRGPGCCARSAARLETRDLTAAVLGGGLEPAAIEMDLPAVDTGTLGVLFEGDAAAVAVRSRAASTLLGAATRSTAAAVVGAVPVPARRGRVEARRAGDLAAPGALRIPRRRGYSGAGARARPPPARRARCSPATCRSTGRGGVGGRPYRVDRPGRFVHGVDRAGSTARRTGPVG